MSSEKVWSRFETIEEDGRVLKLRIQDLPSERVNDALDLIMNVFIRDETIYKAVDIRINTEAVKELSEYYYNDVLRGPSCRVVICCSDDTDDVKDILGVSMMRLTKETMAWVECFYSEMPKSPETKEISEKQSSKIFYEMKMAYDPMKEFNLDIYYDDEGAVILPAYRGWGIGKQFVKVRRMMCKAHRVPMTGAWMTALGSQKAAASDGWETVCEIAYDYLAKKYNVNFTDVPPTMKLMIARAHNSKL